MYCVTLKPGKDALPRKRHPWCFKNAVDRVDGSPEPGELVAVRDSRGGFVAYGYYNERSEIRVRLLEWDESTKVDDAWWERRITEACDRRTALFRDGDSTAMRLVYAESDMVPGLVVDRYGPALSVQFLTAGVERARSLIARILAERLSPSVIVDKSPDDMRSKEGLPPSSGVLYGELPASPVEFLENGLRFSVDLSHGQKTGYFLDQRDNRRRVASYARGRSVLDCFSYSGSFAVHALAAGASEVSCLDSSKGAMDSLRDNLSLNGFSIPDDRLMLGDAFATLRRLVAEGRTYDMVILDPPKLAPTKASLDKALRAYKDLALQGFRLLGKGGILAAFSCSQAVDPASFRRAVSWAALDAGVDARVLETLSHAKDHPLRLSFPEGEYLKGLVVLV